MHDPQRAQSLDQVQLAGVEIVELIVPFHQLQQLSLTLIPFAGHQHPQVLNGRPGHGVIKVHKMRRIGSPQHIARMAVTMDALQPCALVACEYGLQSGDQIIAERVVGTDQ